MKAGLDLQAGIVTGKAGGSMDWSVNTAYKTYKGTNSSFKFDWKNWGVAAFNSQTTYSIMESLSFQVQLSVYETLFTVSAFKNYVNRAAVNQLNLCCSSVRFS